MKILEKQLWHLISLIILSVCLYLLTKNDNIMLSGGLWGIDTTTLFIASVTVPVLHQLYVLIFWRLELYKKTISGLWGSKGFAIYKFGFAVLILSRLVMVIVLAFANKNTLTVEPVSAYVIAAFFCLPVIYLFYSVKKYFGIDRAFGIDHFEPDKMKNQPFVKKGIFQYTSNGMYLYGFLILWIPGLLLLSKASLTVAIFNHAFIWAHYYFTELPDMKYIYGDR